MPSMTDFLTAPKSVGDKQIKTTIRNIDYKKLFESPFQYRKFSDSDVSKLASLILMDGRVLEPLIVRKKGGDSFEILSGHKRHSACKYLVEELGEEQFSMIPCSVLELDDIKAEFCVYSTNGYGVKTSYEQMKEIEGMTKLLTEHKDSFPRPKGKRTVEIIAEELNLSRSTVTDFQRYQKRVRKKFYLLVLRQHQRLKKRFQRRKKLLMITRSQLVKKIYLFQGRLKWIFRSIRKKNLNQLKRQKKS